MALRSLLIAVCLAATACVHERHAAAIATQCVDDKMIVVHSPTTAEEREAVSRAKTAEALAITFAIVMSPLLILGGGGSRLSLPSTPDEPALRGPTPPGWPHLWYGCNNVALCRDDATCEPADWMRPEAVPQLMELSTQGPFVELGFSDCGDPPPHAVRTGLYKWDLFLCNEKVSCFVVTKDKQFECTRDRTPPRDAQPEAHPSNGSPERNFKPYP